jgi:hypothetical protein
MDRNSIPNLQINESKYNKSTFYNGSVYVALPYWLGYRGNYACTAVINDEKFCIGIENSTASGDGFSSNQGQVNAYFHLLESHETIKAQIIQSLKDTLPNLLLTEYSSLDTTCFPKVSALTPEFDFKDFIGPSSINIEKDVKDNIAYISWNFYCLWDTEHGFDIITHKDRILEISPQSDKFIIHEDNGTAEEVKNSFEEYLIKASHQKKWWKFW